VNYHRVCNKSNTTDATAGTGTAHPSGSSKSTPVLSEVCIARSLVLCVIFGRLLFVPSLLHFWSLYCLSFYDLPLLV
jgi:hypothetical protein